MRKAIIVDDEKMIRIGIRNVIPWEELGVGHVCLASGPREALEQIEAHRPEIMICDINMPEMTGLELIGKVRDIVPQIKIVVLTGYDKFEYARDSLRLHVEDFFLKPVDEEELAGVIKRLVIQLEEDEKKEKEDAIYAALSHYQVEGFMGRLVKGKQQKEEIAAFCEQFHFPIMQRMKVIILIPPLKEQAPDDMILMDYEIKEICMGFIHMLEGETIFTDSERNTILVLKKDADSAEFSRRLRQISSVLEMEFGAPPQIIQGKTAEGYEQLQVSYQDAYNIKKENQSMILKETYSGGEQSRYQKWEENFFVLKKALLHKLDDLTEVLSLFSQFMDEAKAYHLSSEMIAANCFDLVSAVYYQLFESQVQQKENQLDMFLISIQHGEKDDIFMLTRNFIERLLGKGESETCEIVSQAKVYIHDHLTEELSVAAIASRLYVTPNYFSRLFKSVTGEGCNDYIVRKRIQKAENLLVHTNMKAGKIGAAVGYNDANYFSLAFKKQTGFSPTQYREQKRRE